MALSPAVPEPGNGSVDMLYLSYVPRGHGWKLASRNWPEGCGIPELVPLLEAVALVRAGILQGSV